jgi:hypothetical protein
VKEVPKLVNTCELNAARVPDAARACSSGLGAFGTAVFGLARITDDRHGSGSFGFRTGAVGGYTKTFRGARWATGMHRSRQQWALISPDAVIGQQQDPTNKYNALKTRTAVTGGVLGSHPAREPV